MESILSGYQNRPIKNALEEIMLGMNRVYHLMKIVPGKDVVVVLVTKKSANQGMGWLALREAVPFIAKVLPREK